MNTLYSPSAIQDLILSDDNAGLSVVWLYGSQATGTATSTSDIDIAVAFAQPLPDTLENYLRPERLAMQWRSTLQLQDNQLSIVDINRAPVPLAYNIITQGRVIYCRSDLRLRTEEQRIWSLWEHYKYEHEHNRQAL
jgi:predicted nucleotidyltransferase